ncbi:MAG: hypothetical protein COA74_07145 [Gammaproteobacteria bacterium]|nr:MAG: hypothetical protein COA74_07145 [Gammaproteobacteria bacterium]
MINGRLFRADILEELTGDWKPKKMSFYYRLTDSIFMILSMLNTAAVEGKSFAGFVSSGSPEATDMAENGGWITYDDLASFPDQKIVPALKSTYRGYEVLSLPPPFGTW